MWQIFFFSKFLTKDIKNADREANKFEERGTHKKKIPEYEIFFTITAKNVKRCE